MLAPIDFKAYIADNAHKLRPPVNNAVLHQTKDFIVMVVGGPNQRSDYHINQTSEWFYQYKGSMVLKIVDESCTPVFRDVEIKEGEMFLLPPLIPHCPTRFENTIGIVVEKNRDKDETDEMRWYCSNCKNILHEKEFNCEDITTKIKSEIEEYNKNETLKTCDKCNHVNQ